MTPGVTAVGHDTGHRIFAQRDLYFRIRWRLRIPIDTLDENARLLRAVEAERPDVVFVDSSQVLTLRTLRGVRDVCNPILAFYTPDDIIAAHNLSWPLRLSFREWDVFFTTKTFNVPELVARGVRRPYLIGKAFDPDLHRPSTRAEVGDDYERFDVVFIGTFEEERCRSITRLSASGMSVVVYTGSPDRWLAAGLPPEVELRPGVYDEQYTRAWHHGKVALCFLRKMNRDQITQRTMEIAAIGRPMLAERTDEHDQHFSHGSEYIGFSNDEDLVASTAALLADEPRRVALGRAGRARCLSSGYSTVDRAAELIDQLRLAGEHRGTRSEATGGGRHPWAN